MSLETTANSNSYDEEDLNRTIVGLNKIKDKSLHDTVSLLSLELTESNIKLIQIIFDYPGYNYDFIINKICNLKNIDTTKEDFSITLRRYYESYRFAEDRLIGLNNLSNNLSSYVKSTKIQFEGLLEIID